MKGKPTSSCVCVRIDRVNVLPERLVLWKVVSYLQVDDDACLSDCSVSADGLQQDQAHGRQREQGAHLDADGQRVEDGAGGPHASLVGVHGQEEGEHGEAVVEAAQHEDAVQPLGQDQHGEDVWGDLWEGG